MAESVRVSIYGGDRESGSDGGVNFVHAIPGSLSKKVEAQIY